jgi:hypothetical protein
VTAGQCDRERYDLGRAPVVLALSSFGVLLVALAYAGGRHGVGGAMVAYWAGQVVVFTPVAVRLLSRRLAGVAEAFALVVGLAVNQHLLKWMYSPDQFRFPDELQHWLATTIIGQAGALFRPNPALPPAVHFPGLAEMGAGIAALTGLPVTAAGLIVAGVAHLVFVGVLFAIVLRASRSAAVAGVACVTYATALHYLFFSSMYVYETAALPFLALTVWAARRWRETGRTTFALVAAGSAGGTAVCHHVTALALVATLLLLAVTELVVERPRRWSALLMPAAAAGVVAGWFGFVATDVVGYLAAPVAQLGRTLSQLVGGSDGSSPGNPDIAGGQLAVQVAGLLGLLLLYLTAGRDMIARRDRDPVRWAAMAGGAIFFLGNGVRFVGRDGPEAAGRLATFTYVPIAIVAALALVRALASRPVLGRLVAGSALLTLLMVGARLGGWPPAGSLLPGPYLPGGFERSVDAYGVSAALWERRTLGPGNRVGGDLTAVSLASTYGRQDPVREVAPLFYATEWGLDGDVLVSTLGLRYLVVDRRLGAALPEGGAYFADDPQAGRLARPLSEGQLGKFDALPTTDRLYDNGQIRVYRLDDGE